MVWRIELVGKDLTWFVGSWTVPQWERSGSAAQVIIPVEQMGNLTDEEIGQQVRIAVNHALDCNAREIELDRLEHERYQNTLREKEKNGKKKQPGYIYLMHGIGTNWYKIGKTKHLGKRFKPLSTQGPFPLELIHFHETADMQTDEDYWHDFFADKREEGEWFTLSPEDINLFVGQ